MLVVGWNVELSLLTEKRYTRWLGIYIKKDYALVVGEQNRKLMFVFRILRLWDSFVGATFEYFKYAFKITQKRNTLKIKDNS